MLFKTTSLVALFILIGFASVFWDFGSTEQVLYQENFRSDQNTGSDALTRIDGRKSLNTGSPGYNGSWKWNEIIAVKSAKIFSQWW